MSAKQVEILFICGSPRSHTSEALLALLEQGARDAGARSRRFLLSKKWIAPCLGCGWCEKTGTCILAKEGSSKKANDDYLELLDALAYADGLAVVSPLFFAGPPAQLKALYDRMQPFWSQQYLLGVEPPVKRPAQLFIVGGGGDSHGHEPMVTISRSALAVAGFAVEKVQNFIGFKHPRDVDTLPIDAEPADVVYGEASRIRKAIAQQQDFEQRALAAGSAFARFVGNSLAKNNEEGEAEQADEDQQGSPQGVSKDPSSTDTPKTTTHVLSGDGAEPPKMIINSLDSGFEALKQAARAAKSTQKSSGASVAGSDVVAPESEETPASQNEENVQPDGTHGDGSRGFPETRENRPHEFRENRPLESHSSESEDAKESAASADPDKGSSPES